MISDRDRRDLQRRDAADSSTAAARQPADARRQEGALPVGLKMGPPRFLVARLPTARQRNRKWKYSDCDADREKVGGNSD